jgi:hypothetical protein
VADLPEGEEVVTEVPDTARITLRLTRETIAALKEDVRRSGMSASEIAEVCISAGLSVRMPEIREGLIPEVRAMTLDAIRFGLPVRLSKLKPQSND